VAIVTGMDSRLDVFAALGLHHEAHILRNAGGVITGDTHVLREVRVDAPE
jgi:carbonic anhydrase